MRIITVFYLFIAASVFAENREAIIQEVRLLVGNHDDKVVGASESQDELRIKKLFSVHN